MNCRRCGSGLDRPGDYCLVCHTSNTDTVVLEIGRERSTVYAAVDGGVVGDRVVTTVPETGERSRPVELRNYAGLIADEVRRKRPGEVYGWGDREVLDVVRAELHYRVRNTDSLEEALVEDVGVLDEVDVDPGDKISGRHSTLIGENVGREALKAVARSPYVKKIVPGPISSGGRSRGGFDAKTTRADSNGNLRLLLRHGSAVQENRVITTATDRESGETVSREINEELEDL